VSFRNRKQQQYYQLSKKKLFTKIFLSARYEVLTAVLM